MPTISLVTASYVTRQIGFGTMEDWSEGDRATQDFFAPVDTYEQRFGDLIDDVVSLGYTTIDLWGAHLHHRWATDEHFDAARRVLGDRGVSVNSLAAWCHDLDALEGFCRVANEVGSSIIAGGSPLLISDRDNALAILAGHGVRFAIENHPEKTPDEVRRVIGDSEWLGSCPDTGWWAIQGYDPPTAIAELADVTLTVHLKDVDAETGKGRRPTTGAADIPGCLAALAASGYGGAVGVEHEPDGWDPTDDLRFARELLARWVEAL
ncbi:MAG TPA: sugar phosphate isomerase/epimerase family protein [Acidimicrobiia bacterium]|nr:sugar phosphate isomerase/epimerase family protein [Acidimicrobiia bacterium]